VEACRVDGRRATGDAIPIRDQAKLKRIQQQQTCVELLGAQSRNTPAAHLSPQVTVKKTTIQRERERTGGVRMPPRTSTRRCKESEEGGGLSA
jgi:hypothetical protein